MTEARDATARSLGQLSDFPGLMGRVSYDAPRVAVRDLFWTTVEDGTWGLERP